VVLWSLALLVSLAPLPLGSAEPWCASIIEAGLFLLLATFEATNLGAGRLAARSGPIRLVMPWSLLAGLVFCQLIPLPPAMLKIISPATYRLYGVSLPGWPAEQAYAAASGWQHKPDASSSAVAEPNLAAGAAAMRRDSGLIREKTKVLWGNAATALSPTRWRQLSIAPSLTRRALLKLLAYGSMFFLVVACPAGAESGKEAEWSFLRLAIIAVVLSGLAVAALGIIEVFTWNGKILWFFVPYDWSSAQPGAMPRASGPFINPDHFGDYLAMALPLAVGGALLDASFFSGERARAFRLLCAASALLIAGALLLSLSRGAWIAAASGLMCLAALAQYASRTARTPTAERGRRFYSRPAIICLGLTAIALVFIGPQGRVAVDSRLQETVEEHDGLDGRLQLTGDTFSMAADYPMFGVGLGSWPEIYPQYRRAPWSPVMFREAHDDYAQTLAETGIAGIALVIWFFWMIGKQIRRFLLNGGGRATPVLAMVCAGVVAAAVHECVDFSLQIPANALLATFLLALAARIAFGGPARAATNKGTRLEAAVVIPGAVILAVCAMGQGKIPYPYNLKLKSLHSPENAVEQIRSHPAESTPHLALALLGADRITPDQRVNELRIASRLDPIDPEINDLYARALMRAGHTAEGLAEVRRSVQYSPTLDSHFYLRAPFVSRLDDSEEAAVEQGFSAAIARHYEGALMGLAEFYAARGQFAAAAQAFSVAAENATDQQERVNDFRSAGAAWADAGRYAAAVKAFRRAITEAPDDSQSYIDLMRLVLGPEHQFGAAAALVSEGIQAGADPSTLYGGLAEAAYAARNLELAENALGKAIAENPTFAGYYRLGQIYIEDRKYDRATLALRRAAERDPTSADAYFNLGAAEEADYHFVDAESDFARAVKLAPKNAAYRDHYRDFERRLAEGVRSGQSVRQ